MSGVHTSKSGRMYHSGKPLSSDIRELVVQKLLEIGSNKQVGSVPYGGHSKVAKHFKLSVNGVKNIWIKYCEDGHCVCRARKGAGGGRPRKLNDGDLQFVELCLKEKPSVSYNEIVDKLEQYSSTGRVSTRNISNAVRKFLPNGQYTFKKITRQSADKYNPRNIAYYQSFIDFVSRVDPRKCKFFDESGFKVTVAHRNYGHAPKGEKCVEVGRLVGNPNVTLNLLVSIDGINYFNFIDGPSNTETYVNFFCEAANSYGENGLPALEPGDLVIVDNCPIHRFNGELRVSNFLYNQGVGYIFLPRYSPELNIAENCFMKVKSTFRC